MDNNTDKELGPDRKEMEGTFIDEKKENYFRVVIGEGD